MGSLSTLAKWGPSRALPPTALTRSAMDIAMIGLMRVSEVAALTWGDVWHLRGGSGQVRVSGTGETEYRGVRADTMRLLLSIRHGAVDDELVLGMRPNQVAVRTSSRRNRRASARCQGRREVGPLGCRRPAIMSG